MLKALFIQLGTTGAIITALLATVSLLMWMPAVASVTTSSMHWAKKLPLQLLLALFPPSAMVVLGVRAVGRQREENRRGLQAVGRMKMRSEAARSRPRLVAADREELPARFGVAGCRLCRAA
jgi:membrane protein implicated in regulation of membrane protease activity